MLRRLVIGVMLLGLTASCADGVTEQVSTSTAATTATVALPTTGSGTTLGEDVEVWDLVYVSDSTGWGVANKYAARIEADLGVQVEVHDLWGGGLPLLNVLEALRGEEASGLGLAAR